jgi:hypothetical protein
MGDAHRGPYVCCTGLQEKKPNLVGQEVFTQRATHLAYERRADKIAPDLAAYEAAKAAQPDRALALDPMEYGKGHQVGFCGFAFFGVFSEWLVCLCG